MTVALVVCSVTLRIGYVTVSRQARSCPRSPGTGVYVAVVAPEIAVPSRNHWNPSKGKSELDGWVFAQLDQTAPPHDCATPSAPPPATAAGVTSAAGAPTPNRPIAFVVPESENQRLPSGPVAIRNGTVPGFSPALYSVIAPPVVIRPIAPVFWSVNHRFPSGPGVIPRGEPPGLRPVENSVIVPSGRDPPDRRRDGADVGEPQVPVRPRHDRVRQAPRAQARAELRHRGRAPDLDPADRGSLAGVGEPEVPVRSPP